MFNKIGYVTTNIKEGNWRLKKEDGEKKTNIIFLIKKNRAFVIAPIADMIIRSWKELYFPHV